MTLNILRHIETTAKYAWQEREAIPFGPATATADLIVTDTGLQHWEGFGGCFNELGWIAMAGLASAQRDSLMQQLFGEGDGCRFTLCRLPIGASDYAAEWYSLNETPDDLKMEHFSLERDREYLLPYIKAALAIRPEMTLFASPWSPPTWMKHPRAYNNGTLVWTPEILEAYALYFLKFVRAYAEHGIRIAQVHVQNEPNSDQKFPSCLWTGAKFRDFIREHLGPLFEREALDCQIWAGTIEREDYNAWTNTILSDEGARRYVAGLGFQWAGKGQVQRAHEAWPEMRLMQTENECGNGDNSWGHACHVFDLMRHFIGNGVNAYIYWNMVLQPGGHSTWGWPQNAMITVEPATGAVTYNPEFHLMRHFSQFVKPGAQVLKLAGHDNGAALGFRNPGGERVLVLHNPFDRERVVTIKADEESVAIRLAPDSFHTLIVG